MPKALDKQHQARKAELAADIAAAAKFWEAISDAFFEGEGAEMEYDTFTTIAIDCGLLATEPYDPEKHADVWGDPEEGDDTYVFTERGRRLATLALSPPKKT